MDQPARSWSEFVGMTARDDAVVLDVEPRHYNADGGVLHGGIIASLMLHAAVTAAPQTRVLDCQINYLKSIKAGRAEARARVRRAGRRFTVIDTELTGPDEVLLASASWVLVAGEIDQAPVRAHQALALPAPAAEASPIGRLLDAFNANMAKRLPGIAIERLQPGYCLLTLADTSAGRQASGEGIDPGLILLAMDNAAIFAGFGLLRNPTRASTIDLKMTLHGQAHGDLRISGHSLTQRENLVHNLVMVRDEANALIAHGSMSFVG
ncbi:MAG: thioesterase family protein [Pseudomonadota bacterium]|nr:thioesterase family protein [Pseudomonadota bacterium]